MATKSAHVPAAVSLASVQEALGVLFPTLLPEESELLASSLLVKSYAKNYVIYPNTVDDYDDETPDGMRPWGIL